MQISHDPGQGNQVKSYETGEITIGEQTYHESLILSQDSLSMLPDCHKVTDITESLLQSLLDQSYEIILIGSGDNSDFLDPKLIAYCGQRRVGVECMPTRSACRTFNVLATEERRVVALLII